MASIAGPTLDGFRVAVERYFDALMGLGDRLLGPLAICLGMPPRRLRERYGKPIAFMRLFHYPPDSNVGGKGIRRGRAQGLRLPHHPRPGCQWRTGGSFAGGRARAGAAAHPHTFVINVGDMLSEITKGGVPVRHRTASLIVPALRAIRFRIFFDPDFDATFEGLPDVSAGEFLLNKFDKFYKYRQQQAAAAS